MSKLSQLAARAALAGIFAGVAISAAMMALPFLTVNFLWDQAHKSPKKRKEDAGKD